jgi:hypothetical protein
MYHAIQKRLEKISTSGVFLNGNQIQADRRATVMLFGPSLGLDKMGALQFAHSRLVLRRTGSIVRRSGGLHECDERGIDGLLIVGITCDLFGTISFGSDCWHIGCIAVCGCAHDADSLE